MCRAEEKRGGTGAAIRTLWAKIELQEHKDPQHVLCNFSRIYGSDQNPYCVVCARSTVADIY